MRRSSGAGCGSILPPSASNGRMNSAPTMIPLQHSSRTISLCWNRIVFFLAVALLAPCSTSSFSVASSCDHRRIPFILSAIAPPEALEDSYRTTAAADSDDAMIPQKREDDSSKNEEKIQSVGETKPSERKSESSSRMAAAERRRRLLAADLLRSPRSSSRTTCGRVVDAVRKSALTEQPKVVTRSVIHSAIQELMEQAAAHHHESSSSTTATTSSFIGKSIGVLGDPQDLKTLTKQRTNLSKLTVLEDDDTVIRMATTMDDFEIANLRLSVFADFSLQQRSQFCARSCQAIAARRKRGASCLVATSRGETSLILGSVECSFHEFYGTQLGRRRKQHSILYVTEVAVSPSARRRGIGTSLLKGIDIVANKRSIETLYLHVDVSNVGAIRLYEKSGYRRVANAPMFQEFTKSLNLHPGATKGRDHFLYFKNLTSSPVWLDASVERQLQRPNERRVLEVFGFEIPA